MDDKWVHQFNEKALKCTFYRVEVTQLFQLISLIQFHKFLLTAIDRLLTTQNLVAMRAFKLK